MMRPIEAIALTFATIVVVSVGVSAVMFLALEYKIRRGTPGERVIAAAAAPWYEWKDDSERQ